MNLEYWDYFIADCDRELEEMGIDWKERDKRSEKTVKELHNLMYSMIWDDKWLGDGQ